MLAQGKIIESNTNMGAPIIFVPKPNVMEIQRYFGNAKHFT
jgi:hypothetical protein